jgi:Domain of unknown function (DUF4345)
MSGGLLRVVLLVVGAVMIALGLNVGLGGIKTLGWQTAGEFVQATDIVAFSNQDNHVRFLGGFWLGAGLLMAAGSVFLTQLRSVLVAITAMVFVAGLARLSAPDPQVVFGAGVLPSLVVELVLYPLLGVWLWRAGRRVA